MNATTVKSMILDDFGVILTTEEAQELSDQWRRGCVIWRKGQRLNTTGQPQITIDVSASTVGWNQSYYSVDEWNQDRPGEDLYTGMSHEEWKAYNR